MFKYGVMLWRVLILTNEQKERIKELRLQSVSYGQIAMELGVKKDAVKSFCQKNNLGGFRAEPNKDPCGYSFTSYFHKKFKGKYEYISGYYGCDSMILVKCLDCSSVYHKSAQMVRKNKQPKCNYCIEIKKQKDIEAKRLQLEKKRIEREERERNTRLMSDCTYIKICPSCTNAFVAENKNKKYCSVECTKREMNRRKEVNRRHRLKRNGKVDYSITLGKLIKRDKGRCALCGKKVNIKVHSNHEYYPSIDHILPVSKGGTHTWHNVQLAHRRCNTLKKDNLYVEQDNGQVTLCI
jgi:hypothetical protein